MVARHFVVRVAEEALDRIGFGAIGRQKHQLDARMGGQPWLDGLRLVNFVVVHHHVDPVLAVGRISGLNCLPQSAKQAVGFTGPHAVMYLARAPVPGPGQITFFVFARHGSGAAID